MYNIVLFDYDLDYGLKIINELSCYNNDLRFCSFVFDETKIIKTISNYSYDIFLISSDFLVKNYVKFEKYKDRIVVLKGDDDSSIGKLFQVQKNDSIENINEVVQNATHKVSYNEDYVKNIIREELSYLGYSPKYYGTKYLCEAIYILFRNNEDCCENLKKVVYPIIGEKYNKTIQNIKCNIINATDIMTCDCEENRLIEYLGFYNYVKPGPKKVIEAVLNKVKEKLK